MRPDCFSVPLCTVIPLDYLSFSEANARKVAQCPPCAATRAASRAGRPTVHARSTRTPHRSRRAHPLQPKRDAHPAPHPCCAPPGAPQCTPAAPAPAGLPTARSLAPAKAAARHPLHAAPHGTHAMPTATACATPSRMKREFTRPSCARQRIMKRHHTSLQRKLCANENRRICMRRLDDIMRPSSIPLPACQADGFPLSCPKRRRCILIWVAAKERFWPKLHEHIRISCSWGSTIMKFALLVRLRK